MSLSSPYPINEVALTANGEGLKVSYVGSTILKTLVHPIKLNYVLYIPKLSKNLLSVHRICLDNNCWLIFDAFGFWIQGKATGRILFKGLCSNAPYPIPSLANHYPSYFQRNFKASTYVDQLISSSFWHSRLGHLTNTVVSTILNKAQIACPKNEVPIVCHNCLEGKFRKLPF